MPRVPWDARGPFAFTPWLAWAGGLALTVIPWTLSAQEVCFSNSHAKAFLVELYTSEGCSSCPPAEAWLNDLTKDPRLWKEVFPLAFHVDYWDGLGWPDRFAQARFTQRQQTYAARLHQDSVYTPEFIIDGAEYRGWFHGQPWPATPATTRGALSLVWKAGDLSAQYAPASPSDGRELTLNVALLGSHLQSDVKAGENSGRVLAHEFVVLSLVSKSLTAAGGSPLRWGPLSLVSSGRELPQALVGWVSGSDGSILQVVGGWIGQGR